MLAPILAHAVVGTTSGTPASKNTSWSAVGKMSGASAVAIGPHLLLTAGHVAAGNFSLDGTTYHLTSTQMGPTIKGQVTDLRAVWVSEALPSWYTIGGTVSKSSVVTMVGYGATGVVNAAGTGYDIVAGTGTRRSATNVISGIGTMNGRGPAISALLHKAGDGVLATGDSGGGWFVNGQLVGISDYTFTNSPSKLAYGFSKTGYFGSGAINLTDKTIHAWITVVSGSISPVPEPGSFAALGLGGVAFLRRRKR